MDKKGGVTFFRRSFFVPNCRKTSCAHPPVFQNCFGIKSLQIIGVSQVCQVFLSHIAKNHRGRTRLFQKYSCFKTFWIMGASRFCRLFLSHSAEKFVEIPPMIQKI